MSHPQSGNRQWTNAHLNTVQSSLGNSPAHSQNRSSHETNIVDTVPQRPVPQVILYSVKLTINAIIEVLEKHGLLDKAPESHLACVQLVPRSCSSRKFSENTGTAGPGAVICEQTSRVLGERIWVCNYRSEERKHQPPKPRWVSDCKPGFTHCTFHHPWKKPPLGRLYPRTK